MKQNAHATYGPSSSKRWMNCYPSTALALTCPPSPDNVWSKEGTAAHMCLETFFKELVKGTKLEAVRAELRKKFLEEYEPDVVEEMLSHAYGAYVYSIEREGELPGAVLESETKVDISPFTKPGEFGTCDVAIIQEFGKLIVIDFKYGAGLAVDIEFNTQLILYALGWAHRYHYNFEEIEMVIIQPRANHESGNTTRTWSCTMDELLEWGERFKAAVAKGERYVKGALKAEVKDYTPAPPEATGDGDWCRYCPAKVKCPALTTAAMARAKIAFSEADELPVVQSVPVVSKKSLTPAALGQALTAATLLERWIDSLREHAAAMLEAGTPVPGWHLEPKRASTLWRDVKKARKAAEKFLGKDALTAVELKSPAQIRDALKERGYDAEAWLKIHTTKISSGVNLAAGEPANTQGKRKR